MTLGFVSRSPEVAYGGAFRDGDIVKALYLNGTSPLTNFVAGYQDYRREQAPKGPWQLVDVADEVFRSADDFVMYCRACTDVVERLPEEVRAEVEKRLSDDPNLRDHVDSVTRAEFRLRRHKLLQSAFVERRKLLKKIRIKADLVSEVARMYPSPAAILWEKGLGSERRHRLVEELRGVAPDQLRQAAFRAVLDRDKELGAAILSVAGTRDSLPFSAEDLADRLCGGTFERVQEAVTSVRRSLEKAMTANAEFAERHRHAHVREPENMWEDG